MRTLQLYGQSGNEIGLYNTLIQDDETLENVIEGVVEYIKEKFELEEYQDEEELEVFDRLLLKNGIERIFSDGISTNFSG